MITVSWPNSPIVQLDGLGDNPDIKGENPANITWNSLDQTTIHYPTASYVTVTVRCVCNANMPNWVGAFEESFYIKIVSNDLTNYNNPTTIVEEWPVVVQNPLSASQTSLDYTFKIPLMSKSMSFTVTVANMTYYIVTWSPFTVHWYLNSMGIDAPFPYGTDSRTFFVTLDRIDENDNDFTLDYIPLSIVYCPPNQDMTNALTQGSDHGTVVTVGGNTQATTSNSDSSYIGAGLAVQGGILNTSGQSSQTNTNTGSNSIGVQSFVSYYHSFSTTVTADNQKAIGRKYWGPLGDIFVLVKNPQFKLRQVYTGSLTLIPQSDGTEEIVTVPAHKLLRPDGDPIAEQIDPFTRLRLLTLDPFIGNLDQFFPVDTGQDLSIADNRGADPTAPYYQPNVTGRAFRIARYSIDNGVEIDLSTYENIKVDTNSSYNSEHYSQVVNSSSSSWAAGFNIPFNNIPVVPTISGGTTSSYSTAVRIGIQNSAEFIYNSITSAKCQLIRNQNESDLNDIEIWWDIQFSTFMFRVIDRSLPSISGHVFYSDGLVLPNILVVLNGPTSNFRTTTDKHGCFVFPNIKEEGPYKISVGNVNQPVKITKKNVEKLQMLNIKNVKRVINPKTASLWELNQVGISTKDALGIKKELQNVKKLNKIKFSSVLKKNNIQLNKIQERAVFKYA